MNKRPMPGQLLSASDPDLHHAPGAVGIGRQRHAEPVTTWLVLAVTRARLEEWICVLGSDGSIGWSSWTWQFQIVAERPDRT